MKESQEVERKTLTSALGMLRGNIEHLRDIENMSRAISQKFEGDYDQGIKGSPLLDDSPSKPLDLVEMFMEVSEELHASTNRIGERLDNVLRQIG